MTLIVAVDCDNANWQEVVSYIEAVQSLKFDFPIYSYMRLPPDYRQDAEKVIFDYELEDYFTVLSSMNGDEFTAAFLIGLVFGRDAIAGKVTGNWLAIGPARADQSEIKHKIVTALRRELGPPRQ